MAGRATAGHQRGAKRRQRHGRAQPRSACSSSSPRADYRPSCIESYFGARPRFLSGHIRCIRGGWSGVRCGSAPDPGRSWLGGTSRLAGLAAALVAVWLLADPHTPDLAAQVYRAGLFDHFGFAVWDEHWYAGHAPARLQPAVRRRSPRCWGCGSWARCRCLPPPRCSSGRACAIYGRSRALGSRLVRRRGRRRRLDRTADLRAGRHVRARRRARARPRAASLGSASLAALCAAASPVAGVLLALAGSHPRARAALAARAARAGGARRGRGRRAARAAVSRRRLRAVSVPLVLRDRARRRSRSSAALPPGQRLLRLGAVVYLLACLLCPARAHADGQQHRALRRAARRTAAAVRAGARRPDGRGGPRRWA